jgi:hypothetical protein
MPDPVIPPAAPAPTNPGGSDSNTTKIAIGVFAGIATIAIAIFLASKGADSADSCTLSVWTVSFIAAAANHGESANAVIKSRAFKPICTSLVKTVINEPGQQIEAEIKGLNGESVDFEGTGAELVSPAPPPPPSTVPNFQRILDCVRSYDLEVLVDLCVDEAIEPTL